ncbi:GNAT family N-acetyltransferase [Cohnella silvisoli]|uniref:GNAT family N-acetyltransferase n=1 Tax=Cohnella silvisoli TaxID=2873699 RepID=A0ABV1KW75_9BACL|nr:GNAT family N-acetyltransferase [Cohnella silvisoli]MCD9023627.1 GNAT family N-acetyltransferase [Cohnella silvisoli]
MEIQVGEYLISDDKSLLQMDVIQGFLSRSYWAAKRPFERTAQAIQNSNCYGVYDEDKKQIGFARVVTDDATIFYLCDVFVNEDHRGQGIGTRLVAHIFNEQRYEGMLGLLGTADAHGLYEKFGFMRDAERFMKKPPAWRADA